MLIPNQYFKNRQNISDLLGGDVQKGIAPSSKLNAILLFTNEEGLYKDYFYPKNSYKFCLYTGIGTQGNQDSINNNMYQLNIDVLSHRHTGRRLLLFERRVDGYYFVGEYKLTETHQNIQPDKDDALRRVFIFHLERVNEEYLIEYK